MNRLFLLFMAAICLVFNTYAMSAPSDRSNTMPNKIKVALLSRTLDNSGYHDPTYDIETDYVDSLAKSLNVNVEYIIYPTVSALHQAISNKRHKKAK